MMKLQIPKQDIIIQLILQLESHFLLSNIEKSVISDYIDLALEKCESNFGHPLINTSKLMWGGA
mgnify:CR=1 FL=1